ncbi:amidohydrolase [Lignipirellula cremea]|uniref:amidohydrolase n=1 Tax=Lignipirellula cremea TaxID=2528010 RepID=UPI001E3930D5|nr:amidohydrolase [Lignipirellula cremea]
MEKNLEQTVEDYKYFHSHPELSFSEEQTAARLAEEWKKAGLEVTTDVGGHGVVGMLKNGDGPTLMLRTDLDALPVTEQTGLTYASQVKVRDAAGNSVGVMHACGHDVHLANLVGVVRYLASHRDQWQGVLMVIGQPAEERGAGAKAMLEDGLFKRFGKPDFAVALHASGNLAAGQVGYRAGFAMANVDSVDITLHGKGGHGAQPHTTIDPVVQAAELVMSLQTIVAREISPLEPAVITVGSIHGGTKHNIIGDTCELQLTVRSYSDKVRKHLLDAIARKAKAVALGARAEEPTIKTTEGTPALSNDEKLTQRLSDVFRKVLGDDNVIPSEATMGGEDFGRFGGAGVPILMYRLGSVDANRLAGYARIEQDPPSLHSGVYYPDPEETLRTGMVTMISAALELLPPRK